MRRKSFSVIVPTIGRPTLVQTLRSCDDPLVDEVIVSPDGRQAWDACEALIQDAEVGRVRLLDPVDESRLNQWGHPQRNRACLAARAPWLCFMDDDDVFTPTAFADIVKGFKLDTHHNPVEVPHIFRMRVHEGNEAGRTLWDDPELRECNVATPMFVVPNRALGWWPSRRAGDWGFIEETCALQGDPVFVETVICDVRPEAHDRMPV